MAPVTGVCQTSSFTHCQNDCQIGDERPHEIDRRVRAKVTAPSSTLREQMQSPVSYFFDCSAALSTASCMVGAVAEPPASSFFTVALAAVPGSFSTRASVVFVVIFSCAIAALLSLKTVQLATGDLVSFEAHFPRHFSSIPSNIPLCGNDLANALSHRKCRSGR
jgi:hypothetical protein